METTGKASGFAPLVPAAANAGPRVVVIGHDRAENTGPIYAALERAGCQVVATAEAVGGVNLAKTAPAFVVVRADMVPRNQEAALLSAVQGPWRLVVLLGASRRDKAVDLAQVATVERVLIVPPYDFGFLTSGPAAGPVPPVRTVVATPPPPPAAAGAPGPSVSPAGGAVKRHRVRVGFYGAHGGVGVSTAALTAARLLAAETRVILIDATGRGDLHYLLGLAPGPTPQTQGNLTVVLTHGAVTDESVAGYDAIVIDGGRQARPVNARWVELRKPLKDDELHALLGLGGGDEPPARGRSLGRFFSVRITE